MTRLPSLGALGLGPPTGPIAQYGEEVLEPPKRQKGDDGLTVSVVKWNADNEDQKRCLISLREFVPGEWVYKTPQGRPYDPWEMLKLWNAQEANRPNSQWFFNPSTNLYDIPRSEFVNDVDGGLSGWEQTHKESERPSSPEASPMDLAKLVHQPPPNPDGTAFVQRAQPRPHPETVFEPPHANSWQHMSYAGFRTLTREFMSRGGARGRTYRIASGWLTRWRTRLAEFFGSYRNLQRDYTSLWFTAGFVVGKITVGWYIQHETSSTPRVRATRSSSGSGHRVEENYLDVHCAVHPSFVGVDTPLGAQGSASPLRKRMLSAFTGFRSDSDLRELARSISDADFRVYLGREGGDIVPTILPGGVRRRRPLNSADDKLGLSITITPRLVAAIEAGNIVPGRAIAFPGTAELVAAHYGAPKHAYATMAYPAYWSTAPGVEGEGPEVDAEDVEEALRASKEKWKSIIAWFVRSLYTATVDARRDMYPYRSGTTLYLAGPHPPALDELVRYYGSPDAATLAAQSLADTVVDGNYAEWENGVGEEEVEDSEYHQWVDVPFWFAEAVVDAEAARRNPIQDN